MTKMDELLNQARLILEKVKVSRNESRLRGEQFNIFHVCGVNHYEVTHSTILAEFLNPQGSHGQGDTYLKAFLSTVGKSDFLSDFDTSTASINTEFSASNGRMDILITNDKRQAIIIENKIYAPDQPEQLKRYNNFALNKYHEGNYAIFYLTLWGSEASEQSAKGVKYTCISYKETILTWLEHCIQLSAQKPLVRETMIQYANLIKELTNQTMDTKSKSELLELMMNHAEEVAAICKLQENGDFFKYVCETRIRPTLEELAASIGFEYGESGNAWSDAKYTGFNFRRSHLAIYFEADKGRMHDVYYGSDIEGIERPSIPPISMFGKPCNNWPYGLASLDRYRYWDMNTLADIINNPKDFVDYIKGKINAIVDELNKQGVKFE